MKSFKVFLLLLSVIAFGVQAQDSGKIGPDDKSCRQVYNESYLDLRNLSLEFNNGEISNGGFATKVVTIDARLNSMRAICFVVESPDNKKCVEVYKKRFKALRKEVKITSVLLGNQSSVKPDIIEAIGNEFSTLYYQLKCGDLNL